MIKLSLAHILLYFKLNHYSNTYNTSTSEINVVRKPLITWFFACKIAFNKSKHIAKKYRLIAKLKETNKWKMHRIKKNYSLFASGSRL